MLSVFDQQGHPSGKEFIHWLTDEEKDSTHACWACGLSYLKKG